MARLRVGLACGERIVREGLAALLGRRFRVVGEAADAARARALAAREQPDVVVVDLTAGLEAVAEVRRASPRTQVVVLAASAEPAQVRGAIAAGALGFLLREAGAQELEAAVAAAGSGRPALHPQAQRHLMAGAEPDPLERLTPRERQVLQHLARGVDNRGIARTLGVAEGTVKGYVSAVFVKLGVRHRTQAALAAIARGLA